MPRVAPQLIAFGLIVGSGPSLLAQAHTGHRHPSGAKIIMIGTIVDPSCRFALNLSGPAHRQCAQACADRGVSLVLLGFDGNVYLLTTPGKPAAGENQRLRELAEQRIQVMGTVFTAGGSYLITVDSVGVPPP